MKATYNILSLLCTAALAVMVVSCTSDPEVREFELAFGNSVEPLLRVPAADTYELCRRLAR